MNITMSNILSYQSGLNMDYGNKMECKPLTPDSPQYQVFRQKLFRTDVVLVDWNNFFINKYCCFKCQKIISWRSIICFNWRLAAELFTYAGFLENGAVFLNMANDWRTTSIGKYFKRNKQLEFYKNTYIFIQEVDHF